MESRASYISVYSKQMLKRLSRSCTIRFMCMTFELSLLTESDIVFTTGSCMRPLTPLSQEGQSALTKSVHHLCEPTGALSTWCALNGEMVCLIECMFPGMLDQFLPQYLQYLPQYLQYQLPQSNGYVLFVCVHSNVLHKLR